jgi:hypothetical protein
MLTGCREYRPRLIELARGGVPAGERAVLMAHVELCADCARVLDDQMALSAALVSLAGEPLPETRLIEARVLAAFDRAAAYRRRTSRWVALVGLAAAAMVVLVWVTRRPPVARPGIRVTADTAAAVLPAREPVSRPATAIVRVRHKRARPASTDDPPFVPVPYTIPPGPDELTTVVNMQIPVAALIAAGFDVPMLDPGSVVDAEVLVSEDGRIRAIRTSSASK